MEILQTILSICGGISIIGGAAAVIWKCVKPATVFAERVETLERHDKETYKHMEEMKKIRDELTEIITR